LNNAEPLLTDTRPKIRRERASPISMHEYIAAFAPREHNHPLREAQVDRLFR
jgi:hypothetical protein